jgi:lipopolysaccharide transport system ATP-binding protein
MEPVIKVTGLGKQYMLGKAKTDRKTLGATLGGLVTAPLRMLRGGGGGASETKSFWALKDVNFEINPGEVVGIIGRNGAGKSTLLKVLSRITDPTEGEISITGRVGSLLEVGTGFHPELTGRENVFLNGAILGMKKTEIVKKFDEIVAFAETEKFLDTPVKFYSSGMYTRLAFAVAAHLDPEILIVDEVLAVGDAEFQKKCMGKMQSVAGEGRTVLFVSHNIAAVRQLCTNAICMNRGQVIYRGKVTDALRAYGDLNEMGNDEVRDLRGREIVIVRSVELFVRGVIADDFASGDDAEIVFDLAFTGHPAGMMRIGIAFESPTLGHVLINYSHFQAVEFEPRSGRYTAKLKHLPVVPGVYQLHLRILLGDQEVFWTMKALSLTVQGGDFFGTGIRGEEGLCPWLYEVEWSGAATV